MVEDISESYELWKTYMWNNKFQIKSVIWVPTQKLMSLAKPGTVTKAD